MRSTSHVSARAPNPKIRIVLMPPPTFHPSATNPRATAMIDSHTTVAATHSRLPDSATPASTMNDAPPTSAQPSVLAKWVPAVPSRTPSAASPTTTGRAVGRPGMPAPTPTAHRCRSTSRRRPGRLPRGPWRPAGLTTVRSPVRTGAGTGAPRHAAARRTIGDRRRWLPVPRMVGAGVLVMRSVSRVAGSGTSHRHGRCGQAVTRWDAGGGGRPAAWPALGPSRWCRRSASPVGTSGSPQVTWTVRRRPWTPPSQVRTGRTVHPADPQRLDGHVGLRRHTHRAGPQSVEATPRVGAALGCQPDPAACPQVRDRAIDRAGRRCGRRCIALAMSRMARAGDHRPSGPDAQANAQVRLVASDGTQGPIRQHRGRTVQPVGVVGDHHGRARDTAVGVDDLDADDGPEQPLDDTAHGQACDVPAGWPGDHRTRQAATIPAIRTASIDPPASSAGATATATAVVAFMTAKAAANWLGSDAACCSLVCRSR
jgi:hypothetical protein